MSETESTNRPSGGQDPVPADDESANPFEEGSGGGDATEAAASDVRAADRRNGDPVDVTESEPGREPVHHDQGGDIGEGAD
ncbi:MAG: hypothetical protein ACYC2O_09310 [Microthrixaceae bacterium]